MKSIDLVEDISFPAQRDQLIKKSSAYKAAIENDIDTDIIEGKQPDENSGVVKFEPVDETEQRLFMKDVANFFLKEVPKDTLISIGKGGVNFGHFLNNIAYALDPNPDEMDERAYQSMYENLDKAKQSLSNFADEESPFVSKLVGMLGQSQMYTYPIYKKLNNSGLPKAPSLIISSAMSEALAFDKSETFFTDSKYFRAVKETFNLPDDTPMGEVVDKFMQFGEYLLYTDVGEKLLKGIIAARKMKADKAQQGAIAVGGGASSGAILDNTISNTENVTESEEKKNLNFDDQSMVPGTVNEYGFEKTAGIVPVFKSMLKETAKKLPNKGSGEQILNTLKNTPGVKQQELKWSGLDDFLKEKKTATKEEVKEYLEKNSLDVSEVQRPRRNTPAEDEQELFLESKLGELDMNIDKYLKANPDALVSNELDKYSYKVRAVGTNFEEETVKDSAGKLRAIFDAHDLTDEILLSKFKYKDKVVLHFLRDTKQDPRNLVGSKPYPVEEADRLLKQDGFERSSRYEFEPLEVRKYFTNKELMKFDERLQNSGTKFDTPEYTEPGGEDYKELIFKLKNKDKDGIDYYPIEQTDTSGNKKLSGFNYRSPSVHFGTKNEFAHVRFKTRYMEDPPMPSNELKVLTVEEMQSDIVQDMSKNFGERVTDFPFKNNWYELVSKRLIRYAADNDFDAVAIPKGSTIAKRYQQKIDNVKEINLDPRIGPSGNDLRFVVTYFAGGNREIKRQTLYNDEILQLQKELGPKNYLKIKDQVDEAINSLKTPEDFIEKRKLIIGKFDKPIQIGSGKGKADLYDRAIPSFLKKYGKKWNAKVYDDVIETDPTMMDYEDVKNIQDLPVTIIRLTDEMKQSVQEDGQALFNIFGIATGATVGTKAVLDNTRNNTISN